MQIAHIICIKDAAYGNKNKLFLHIYIFFCIFAAKFVKRINNKTMATTKTAEKEPKRISKGWLESLKTQGSIIINDPAFA